MAGKYTRGAGVYVTEKDISEVSVPSSNSVGVVVDKSIQGPCNQRILITRDKQFIETFGLPSISLGYGGYAALEYLKYSDSLYFTRYCTSADTYATKVLGTSTTGTDLSVSASGLQTEPDRPNSIKQINDASNGAGTILFSSIGPGTYGNNIGVRIITSASGNDVEYDWKYSYDLDVSATNVYAKVFKVNVYLKDSSVNTFDSVSANPLETFYCTASDYVDANGLQMNITDVINGKSKYIYVKNSLTALPTATTGIIGLVGGKDGNIYNESATINGWSFYKDIEDVNVNILICTHSYKTYPNVQNAVAEIAKNRNAFATFQVDESSDTSLQSVMNINPNYTAQSYGAYYAGWDLVFDKFTSRNIYLPKNIFASALIARSEFTGNIWDAPAGFPNGVINSIDQNYKFNSTEIGKLTDLNINTSKNVAGTNVLWSQKTCQRKNTALRDINVRRTITYIENSLEQVLNSFLQQPNNAKTRNRIKSICDSFLSSVASSGGLNTDRDAGFMVVCDGSNNPNTDTGEIIVDVYLKPIRVVEYIQLNIVTTKSTVNFTELLK